MKWKNRHSQAHGQDVWFYLSPPKKVGREMLMWNHIAEGVTPPPQTFSKSLSLLGCFQQTVAYTAGMSQSLHSRVGAKGVAAVTGTTFSFRTRSREIQPQPPSTQNDFFSFARLTKCQPTTHCQREGKSKSGLAAPFFSLFFFFFSLTNVWLYNSQVQLMEQIAIQYPHVSALLPN